ncbi:MAG: dihydrofolate reductase family protein [Steroidobacteraceae bacterium]
MRRLFVSNLMTLDGFFEGPNGEFDWPVVEEEFFQYAREMLRGVDTILFGRRTYLMMAAYWPAAPRDEIADQMNSLRKLVFSRTLGRAEWNNSHLVRDDAAGEVAKLKRESGKDIVILGSASLASSLLQANLVDEYRVILQPVLLGSGNPLFKSISERIKMKLTRTRVFKTGVVVLYYERG